MTVAFFFLSFFFWFMWHTRQRPALPNQESELRFYSAPLGTHTSQRPQDDEPALYSQTLHGQRSLESVLGLSFRHLVWSITWRVLPQMHACLCVDACLLTLWKDTDYVFSPPLGIKPVLTKQTRWKALRERFVFNSELITLSLSLSVPLVVSSVDQADRECRSEASLLSVSYNL